MRVVTVGGSVAALTAALLLARRGHEVTLVERDPARLPSDREDAWADWARPGVPHFRQLHIFNGRGRGVLRHHLPDVYEAWIDAGAFETPLLADDPEVVRVNSRRTTFEWVLHLTAAVEPGVSLLSGAPVTGLCRTGRRITGVRTSAGDVPADVVVDASGRHGVTSRWVDGIITTHGPCGTVAATRWYRVRSGDVPRQQRADLGYAACVLVPTDGGLFSVTFGYQRVDEALKPLRTVAGFAAAAAAVDPIAAEVDPARAEPVSGVLARGDAANRMRRVGPDAPTNLVLLGDAAVCTNPGYGRGIGLALAHAAGLAEHVGDPAAFEAFTTDELEPWYHAAVASDRARRSVAARSIAGEPRSQIGGSGDDPDVRFARRLPEACALDPNLNRTFQRTWHLLGPPSALWQDPAIRAAVDAAPLAPITGPDHATLAALLAAQ